MDKYLEWEKYVEEMENPLYENIEENERFKIDSLDKVNWAFRRIVENKKKLAEIEALASEELQRITNWADKEKKSYEAFNEHLNALLRQHYKEELENDPKYKVSTPYGKISTRKNTKWSYEDKTILEYCKEHKLDKLYKTTETIDKNEVKKHFKDMIENNVLTNPDGELMISTEQETNIVIKEEM